MFVRPRYYVSLVLFLTPSPSPSSPSLFLSFLFRLLTVLLHRRYRAQLQKWMRKREQYLRSTRRIQNGSNGRKKEIVNFPSAPPRLEAEAVSEFKYHDHLPRCFQSHRKLIVLCRHVHPVYQVSFYLFIYLFIFSFFLFFLGGASPLLFFLPLLLPTIHFLSFSGTLSTNAVNVVLILFYVLLSPQKNRLNYKNITGTSHRRHHTVGGEPPISHGR